MAQNWDISSIIVLTFRVVLIIAMLYGIFTVFQFKTTLKGGDGFKYGAEQLESAVGKPVSCFCNTPKGKMTFNSTYRSAINQRFDLNDLSEQNITIKNNSFYIDSNLLK